MIGSFCQIGYVLNVFAFGSAHILIGLSPMQQGNQLYIISIFLNANPIFP